MLWVSGVPTMPTIVSKISYRNEEIDFFLNTYIKKGKSYVYNIWCTLRGHLTSYPCKSDILCVDSVGNGISLSGGMLGVSVALSFFKQCFCNGIGIGST